MSLKAKIEAVIYAAEEPVTLAQLAALFADELPPPRPQLPTPDPATEATPTAESLIERGFLDAVGRGPDYELAEVTLLTALRQEQATHESTPEPTAEPATADLEAQAKRAARQRDRDVREQLKAVVDELIHEYSSNDRGMEIREVAGGYRIATKPEYHDAVRSFVKSLKPAMKLSLQALETLAVIAYKQPITAPEVSEIRGVDSSGVLGGLIARKLITTAGRKQVIGRPILYKTTREFLLKFGLKDVNELPSIEEFEKLAGDIEIGEEETPEANALPFESAEADIDGSTSDTFELKEAALAANAGEPGLAVESAQDSASEPVLPETIALDAELSGPNSSIEAVEVTPAAHSEISIEDHSAQHQAEENGEHHG